MLTKEKSFSISTQKEQRTYHCYCLRGTGKQLIISRTSALVNLVIQSFTHPLFHSRISNSRPSVFNFTLVFLCEKLKSFQFSIHAYKGGFRKHIPSQICSTNSYHLITEGSDNVHPNNTSTCYSYIYNYSTQRSKQTITLT